MVFSGSNPPDQHIIINNNSNTSNSHHNNMNNNNSSFQSFFYLNSNNSSNHPQQQLLSNQPKSPANNYLPGTANGQINNNLNDYLYQLQKQHQTALALSSSSEEELSDSNDFINTYHHPSTDSLYGSSYNDDEQEFMDESKILQANGITLNNNQINEIDHHQPPTTKQTLPLNASSVQTPQTSSPASVNILNQINHHHHNTTPVVADPQVLPNSSSVHNSNGGLFNVQQQPALMNQSLQQFFPVKQKIKKAILYIDLDNFPISRPSEYLEMLAKIKSKYSIDVTAKKIFGDLNQFEKLPVDFQFSHQLIICPKVSSRKNTTDIALTIEVIKDLERKKPFDVFIIASSDSDFVPVVKAIKDEGKECWILPSHNYPHQTLMSICNGILDFNSHQNVSNPLQELNIPSKPSSSSQDGNKTSPNTSPRKKEVPPKVHIKTNHIPPSQNKLSIVEVKTLITKIIRKLEFSAVKTFNLSFIHEQLRDKSILYNHYGYPSFRALFEEWCQENPKYKFERNEKNGQLSFAQEVHPNILHRPTQPTVPQTPSINHTNVKILPKPASTASLSSSNESPEPSSKPKGSRKALKNSITNIIKNLYQSNPKGSFNMSFVNERMRERGLKYKDHGYDSMKTLFTEWKQEHPTAVLGVRERSGELYFAPSFTL